ncbi:MAG TPA: type VI secretion system tip protein TssI/VgrG, partial [Pirellulales bacterium]
MTLTQAERPLKITTPLGTDKLLIERFEGREAICELFDFKVTVLFPTPLPPVPLVFDKLIGQSVTVDMIFPTDATPTMVSRYFNGIVLSIFEGEERASSTEGEGFLRYVLQIVPTFSLLRHKTQSRIFQRMTVPKILDQIIKTEGAITDYANEVQGTFEERDYCVQYRESDFAFVCRLMEEEGIFWFFRHEDGKHTLVLANASTSHTAIPAPATITFGKPEGDVDVPLKRIKMLEKRQTIRAGNYTLWDHCFENVGEKYESKMKTLASVAVGTVTHKLNVANDKLELYDYPGAFAQRFDGINRDGGVQADKL